MKSIVLVFCLAIASIGQTPFENGWRGIELFKTTRAEVERTLKPAKIEVTAFEISYRTQEYVVHVKYAMDPCSNTGWGRFSVPKGTVIGYEVNFSEPIPSKDLIWDPTVYERTVDKEVLPFRYYENRPRGLSVTAIADRDGSEAVQSIKYYPSKIIISKFRCGK